MLIYFFLVIVCVLNCQAMSGAAFYLYFLVFMEQSNNLGV